MANEANIHVKEPAGADRLYTLLDKVEQGFDETRSAVEALKNDRTADRATVAEVVEQLRAKETALTDIKERLDNLDARLPKGEKVYQGILQEAGQAEKQAEKEAREMIARSVLDIATFARSGKTNIFKSGIVERADGSQTEGTPADGGYLVPETQAGYITRIVERYGVARSNCTIIPMTRKEHRLPVNEDLPDVYWDTQLDAEELSSTKGGGTPIDTKISFSRPALVAHKLIGISSFSIEVEEDAIPAISTFLVDVFGMAIARAEDAAFLTDNGSPKPFTGLFKVSGITDVVAFGTSDETFAGALTYNNILSVMDSVDEDTVEGGKWFCSNSIVNQMRKVKDTQERPLWGEMASDTPLTLFGRPIVRCRVAPKMSNTAVSTVMLAYGNPRFWAMGDRRQLSIDVSPHVKFTQAGLVMRVMERIAFVPVLKTPFARLKTAAS